MLKLSKMRREIVIIVYLLLTLPLVVLASRQVYQWYQQAAGRPANIFIDASSPQAEINPQLWQNFAQGGEEPKDMIGPVMGKVARLQPQLIRLDHLFDHYQVVQQDGSFDFSRLDQAVFSILRTGAKPLLSLSYIPSQFTVDGQITSPPQDWSRWQKLITATVEHYSGKNGLNINNVYYEVYNEPDLFGRWHYAKEPNYLTLYLHTIKGIQAAGHLNNYKIGGPATTGFYPNWIKALLNFCQENNLPLDFLSWHRYSPRLADYERDFEQLTTILTQYPQYQQVERLITEFGPAPQKSSWYQNRVGAAQAIAVTTHLLDRVHRVFAFELKDGPQGHSWGLLSHENQGAQPKPRWQAYLFLNQLKGKRLPLEGNGSWVSGVAAQDHQNIKILLVNYDPRQKHSEYVPLRLQHLTFTSYRLSLDYLFGPDQQVKKKASSGTLFHQVFLPPNEAVLLTLSPIF